MLNKGNKVFFLLVWAPRPPSAKVPWGKVGATVMNLSKAFDTLNHNLLCELKAYSFDINALAFIQSSFSNNHQRTKVGDKFSKLAKNLNRRASKLYPLSPTFRHFH